MRLDAGPVIVRDFERSDAQDLFRIVHDENIVRFMRDWSQDKPSPESYYGFIDWLQTQKDSTDVYENKRYAVVLKDTQELVGMVGMGICDTLGEVELAYFSDGKFRRRGFMQAAVKALVRWCFENSELPYLILTIDSKNEASLGLAEKCGFRLFEKRFPIGHTQPNMQSESYCYFRITKKESEEMNMAKIIEGGVTAAKGFEASGIHCGIRKNRERPDLALIVSDRECSAAAVYTQNLVKGAPIIVTQGHLSNGKARAVICNSGNANTCNADGKEKAYSMCEIAARQLGIAPDEVIVASTGVIGLTLPIEPIEASAGALKDALSPVGSKAAANAIMTTDTFPKEAAAEFEIGGKTVRVGGISKGSGMIHPNMATMLCFVTTDCAISSGMLQSAIQYAADRTFNLISIDGDSSTNDTFAVLANGAAENPEINSENDDYRIFCEALTDVCRRLAKMMAADGEGATKLLICKVTGASDEYMARNVAKTVVASNLFKAAMFGADANAGGRAMCAIGYSGSPVDVSKIDIAFRSQAGRIEICKAGLSVEFSEELAKKVLSEKEIDTEINLNIGGAGAEAYGCDLTYDYVRINADYRT